VIGIGLGALTVGPADGPVTLIALVTHRVGIWTNLPRPGSAEGGRVTTLASSGQEQASTPLGLSDAEAARRLAEFGPNEIRGRHKFNCPNVRRSRG
jgi:hypothetical protein